MLTGNTCEAVVEVAVVTILAGVATVVGAVAVAGWVVYRFVSGR